MTTTARKFTSTVAGASVLLTVAGLLTRGLGLVREMVFAGSFGLGEEFDIYLVGAVLPLTLQVIILFLIQNYLIPAYNQILAETPEQKDDFVRTNFWIFTLGGVFLSLILYLSSSAIIQVYLPAASPEARASAGLIFNLFLLSLPVSASSSVLIAYLQNNYNFKTPAIARLSVNLAVVIIVFLLNSYYGTLIIPIGFFVGGFIQFFILFYKTDLKLLTPIRSLMIRHHIRNSLNFNLALIIIIETLSQLYAVADRYFVSAVQTGGIAALNYAQTLFVLPIITISMALSTALFPKLSQDYSSDSLANLEKSCLSGIRINILIFIPIMVIFIFFGDEIIKLIYQRGKFSSSDTLMTASALKYFSLSIVFYSIYSILNKIFYSAKWIKMLLIITVAGIFLKLLLNFLLVDKYAQNGLAFSSSVSYFFFFITAFIIIDRKLSLKLTGWLLKELLLHTVCAALAYVVVLSLAGYNMNIPLLSPLLFCVVFFFNLWILKSQSFLLVLNLFNTVICKYR